MDSSVAAGSAMPRLPAIALRPFSSSTPASQRQRAGATEILKPGEDVSSVTGNPDEDGMNIYQLDFLETAAWTKDLLLKMKHHEHLLKGLQQDQPPRDDKAILTFHTQSIYDYDVTKQKPDPANKRVECSFNVSRLVAQAQLKPSQRHYLLLLCGEQYDPATDTVTLSCEKFDERIYNKIYLSDTVDRLIKEVKEGHDRFRDVPLDLRHVAEKPETTAANILKKAGSAGRQRRQPQRWQTPAFWAAAARGKREGVSEAAPVSKEE